MNILQLCKKFPYPLKDGESIAVTYLSNALHELGCEMSLLSMNTTKHFVEISTLPKHFSHYKEIHITPLDNEIKIVDAFKNLFTSQSFHVSRFICPDYANKLIELLTKNEYQVVQLETLYLTPYIDIIKKHSNAIITLRAHNIEFEIWERITKNTKFLPKKWYLKYLTRKLKNYELSNLNSYDYLVAVSERDLKKFKTLGYKNGAIASPIGLDISKYNAPTNSKNVTNDLCFIGALDWIPNFEGLMWFLQNVWPKLHHKYPNLKLHVAGRNTPPSILNTNLPNVVIHGEVNDAVSFINSSSMMIVPLFSGSGMRVKILEGMALEKIVITTSLGKEGIQANHGEHLLEAESPEDFIKCISDVLEGKIDKKCMGANAKEYVATNYNHHLNAKRLLDKYKLLTEDPNYSRKTKPTVVS